MDPPFLDLNEEQPQQDHLFINLNTEISSSLSLSPPLMINHPPQEHGEFFYKEPQRFQLQVPLEADHKIFSSAVSCDDHHPRVVADRSESENSDDLKLTIWKNNDIIQDRTNNDDHKNHTIMSGENFDDSVKWTSSKMRMMRKMIITNQDHHQTVISPNDHHHNQMNFTHKFDQHQVPMKKRNPTPPFGADHSSSSSSNNNNTIRVCSDCNTTKTPLWRSGPRGPKSLCNACGIRQRKARRALAAAAAAANGTILDAASMKTSAKVKHNKEKKTKVGNGNCGNPQFKKRCKLTPSSRGRKKLLCFEDLRISMSKSSAFQRVFPQDEKDAAILLMALSYGLVHG